jgi:RHH-type proline utilization regulon transcriptional repressor/proline dehydrogenase/delta 1-pyrroline-5-carboxylate dehydrogenase
MRPARKTPPACDFAELSAYYLKLEPDLIQELLGQIELGARQRKDIEHEAAALVADVRRSGRAKSVFDDLLQEYGLSTEEGVVLMRLSEALIRTPDFATSRALIRDKIGDADWQAHAGQSDSFLVNQATTGLRFTSAWISATGGTAGANLLAKLGDRVMNRAMTQAMERMGRHFVLGRDIEEAVANGQQNEQNGVAHSYDMLGEAAYTHADAERYFEAYLGAIQFLAKREITARSAFQKSGLSVKLSALHPRYEYAKREACVPILVERMIEIARVAAGAGLWLNIDAEEADRLELSLEIIKRLLDEPSLKDWPGLGMVVQAYQRRAVPVLGYLETLAENSNRRISVRLVKGAYWDSEIKRAQELGLPDYPVFTRKENTDVSYLACARKLLTGSDRILPQFATHNAHTAVAIAQMANKKRAFEFQRLHGMGAALHEKLSEKYEVQSRIYAPVGRHKDLLPYLVRRLLENGANGSFINQMLDEDIPPHEVTRDPIALVEQTGGTRHPKIPSPVDTVEPGRLSARGLDLAQSETAAEFERRASSAEIHDVTSFVGVEQAGPLIETKYSPQDGRHRVGTVACVQPDDVNIAVNTALESEWPSTTAADRAGILNRAADLLEQDLPFYLELCVREAGKTLPDAVAEVREAIDFCRYYAAQAQKNRIAEREALGVVACISPWNFPLAIFLGQVVAALSVGNTVIAKPAEQTPIIAAKVTDLLYRVGVPKSALQLLLGDGAALGTELVRHPDIDGICFTGSTRTAKLIAENLADTNRGDIPFLAETGGINAMIIDSTALLEQAVQDVVTAAFQSAGQRCSACRIVCVQEDVADAFADMLTGAMNTLEIGDPSKLSTDVGPVIDASAKNMIEAYKAEARSRHKMIVDLQPGPNCTYGHFVGPCLIEVGRVSDVEQEVFGPVLHLVRFEAGQLDELIDEINGLGYGLTLGLHTRLDNRLDAVAKRAHVGNLYVNRNQIGAVVGVQPFGGQGLSGTGPKAGGPNYLYGLTKAKCEIQPSAPPRLRSNTGASEGVPTSESLSVAKEAALIWQDQHSPSQRVDLLQQVFPNLNVEHLTYDEVTKLPGPTGEDNTLRLCPRDVILCFGGDTIEQTCQQVSRALAAGASVLLADERLLAAVPPEAWSQLPAGLVQKVTYEAGLAWINLEVDGIVADGSKRAEVSALNCRRPGPILPTLSGGDPIERFFHERTLTIDTTAAGGNASLLAMS